MNNKLKLTRTLLVGFFCMLFLACDKEEVTNVPETDVSGSELLSEDIVRAKIDEALRSSEGQKHLSTALRTADGQQLYMGYYRLYGQESDLTNLENVPSDIDVVILFGWGKPWGFTNYEYPPSFKLKLKNEIIPKLQRRGIKVVVTGEIEIPSGVSHNQQGYAHVADRIMNELIYEYNFDGFDVDIEYIPSGQHLEDLVGVYRELSRYMGKSSGTEKLLVYDTNLKPDPFFRRVHDKVDYVLFQIYGRATDRSLQDTWNAFSPYIDADQFIPGFSFYEENGYPSNVWDDVSYPRNGRGRAYNMARWNPSGGEKKGGVFGYAIDRDGPLKSQHDNDFVVADYVVSKEVKTILRNQDGGDPNPTPTPTEGVVFYEHIHKQGVATQVIPTGSFTLSRLQAFGFKPFWASSATMPNRWAIAVYREDNFGGPYTILYNGRPNNLLDFRIDNLNDQVKSAIVFTY